MKKLLYGLLILLLMIPTGCRKEEDTTLLNVQIFPTRVGNHWQFLSARSDSVKTYHVNDVIKDTLYDAQQWFVLTYDTNVRTICRNTSLGWWFLYQTGPGLSAAPSLYYRYPATVGEQYLTSDSSLVTVVSIHEIITVAAGTFSCYHYHMVHYRENYECEEYFCPAIGFIKHIVYEPGSGIARVAEVTGLVSYHLE
ncbi:MAG: hypothetical protein M0P58_12505 [Bacteroidales bacterium]|nr:hypothetical protein [Bacteroidales bacterium]